MRAAARVLHWLDWRTFTVAGGLLVLTLVGFVIYTGAQSTHDANVAANQRGKAASRRIDMLSAVIAEQQRKLAEQSQQIGRLISAEDALAGQIRQAGEAPVVYVTVPLSTPHATPRATHSPSPAPSRTTRPSPRPTPSPTCTRLRVVGTCRPL